MHCLYGGYNLHQFSDALGLVNIDFELAVIKAATAIFGESVQI